LPTIGQWPTVWHGLRMGWSQERGLFCTEGFRLCLRGAGFFDPNRLIRADLRPSYGEDRFQLLGRIEARVFVLVYTPRPDALRIISARKANARERRQYENGSHED